MDGIKKSKSRTKSKKKQTTRRLSWRLSNTKEKNTFGILLSNCCALEIIDDNYKILKSEEDAYALQAYWKNDKYYQKEIKENGKLSNLGINDRENEKKD